MHDMGRPEVFECARHSLTVGNGPFDQRQARQSRNDLALAGREIVDDKNLVTLRQPMLDEVRAEAAGAAGDQDAHIKSRASGSVRP